jgi:teichuronic acid biosynthesis glycosyltransferase TuaG
MPQASPAPISVIIPCYRNKDTLRRAVVSVWNQTLLPAEIVLIDDASGDGTLEELYALQKESERIKISVLPLNCNGGPGLARNAGWEAATQPWIACLDADDAWHPRKIEIQWNWLQSHPAVALCGHTSRVSAGIIDDPVPDTPQASLLSPTKSLFSNPLPTRSALFRKDLPFRFSPLLSEDYLLWLEIILSGRQAYRLNCPLAFSFRPEYSPGGISGNLWRQERGELAIFNVVREKGLITPQMFVLCIIWSLFKYARRSVKRAPFFSWSWR